jgi:DGQHR domain-containing protein
VSDNDRERAKQARVRIIDDIEYYSELSRHLGKAARYQFLADMFPGMEIPELIEPVNAMMGNMGGSTFYSFVIEPQELLKIAYISHRAKTGEESMKTYQRMVKKSRLKRIAEYIHCQNGIFPTNIIVNIETDKPLRFDKVAGMAGKNVVLGKLYIPNRYRTAWIIDGQHRLYAYSDLEEAKTATLPVVAFENLDPDVQARLFVDINGEQVRVPKSLLSDLWATIHWNSRKPDEQLKALTSRLIKELNEDPRSPLRDRIIHIGGRKTATRNITLAALVDEIRKHQLLGYQTSRKSTVITPGNLFVDDLDTTLSRAKEVISGYLSNYLNNDQNVKRQWELGSGEGGYIGTNSGIIAIIRVLKAILDHLESKDGVETKKIKSSKLVELIWKYQEPVCRFLGSAPSRVIQDFRSQYGEAGFRACTFALLWEINKSYSSFDPPGLREWIQSKNTVNNPRAYDIICEIEKATMKYVTDALKAQFGSDVSQWWHRGVPATVAGPAIERARIDGEYVHFEKFLDFIDWREIIEENYETIGRVFIIDAKPNDSRKKQFKWLSDVNEIRKIAMHPPRGAVTDKQLEYLTRIRDELMPRLSGGCGTAGTQ